MKLSWPLFFMVSGVLANVLTDASGVAPPKWKPYIEHATGLLVLVGGYRAFFINPDGTNAKTAWRPEVKK